jgi:hypothetical protein
MTGYVIILINQDYNRIETLPFCQTHDSNEFPGKLVSSSRMNMA